MQVNGKNNLAVTPNHFRLEGDSPQAVAAARRRLPLRM